MAILTAETWARLLFCGGLPLGLKLWFTRRMTVYYARHGTRQPD